MATRRTSSRKRTNFLQEPIIDKGLTEIPGCGQAASMALNEHGHTKVTYTSSIFSIILLRFILVKILKNSKQYTLSLTGASPGGDLPFTTNRP